MCFQQPQKFLGTLYVGVSAHKILISLYKKQLFLNTRKYKFKHEKMISGAELQ